MFCGFIRGRSQMATDTVSATAYRVPYRLSLQVDSDRLSGMQRDFCAALMAIAGHDLRQPLQVITTAHDLLAASRTGGQ